MVMGADINLTIAARPGHRNRVFAARGRAPSKMMTGRHPALPNRGIVIKR
jgi:hypothetical protein